ncbi:MAG: terminase large subunit domain-containing protein [Verrucomicrobiales bacterium]
MISRAEQLYLRHLRNGFLPYQRKWLADDSRFKIGLWARQTGKDHTCAAEAVFDCQIHPGTMWVILACGERQALESLEKARTWARLCDLEVADFQLSRSGTEALLKTGSITWSNGSRLLALPAKPETMRGYSANLILTEFAFHEQAEEIWRAIYPSISNPLRGGKKALRIISTPNGKGNKFYDLWQSKGYSKHRLTINEAVAHGLPLDLKELREGLNDPEAWAQEYQCEFMDTTSVLLPYEVISRCESSEATEHASLDELSARTGALYAGIDFGRRNDLTVCWILEQRGEQLWTSEVLTLDRVATPEQVEHLQPRLKRVRKVCLDYTGAGVGLGDYLAREFGEFKSSSSTGGKVELCQFTAALKAEIFSKLRMAFERGSVRVPVSRAIREDLHGMQRVVTPGGQVTYRCARTDDGHGDRSTALALALRAAAIAGPVVAPSSVIAPPSRGFRVVRSRKSRIC